MLRRTLLTVVILALSASTVWLAIELGAARQELAALRAAPAASPAAPEMSATPAGMRPIELVAEPDATRQSRDPPPQPRSVIQTQSDAARRAATLAHNARVRAWLDDPAKRARALTDSRKGHERDVPRALFELDDVDHNRLLDTLAESDLRYAEAIYRCNMDTACDLRTVIKTEMLANRRELAALLGEEKTQRLETYRDNYLERNSVASFRSGLPESMPLSDTQVEKLTEALGEERRRMLKEWQQRGEEISGMGNAWGSLNYPNMQDVAQRLAEATEFQRRQRDRAAEVLTSAQLELFTKQQEQMLEIARGAWEVEDQTGKSQ